MRYALALIFLLFSMALALAGGATNINTNGAVSVGPAATLIVAQRIDVQTGARISVTIVNVGQAVSLCIGNAGVTAATGVCLPAVVGASITLNVTSAIYGVWADGSTHPVSFVESY